MIRAIAHSPNAGQSPLRSVQRNNISIATGFIRTLAPSGTSGNIRLNTFSTSGDIRTANLNSIGEFGAGNIDVVAADGSIITGRV